MEKRMNQFQPVTHKRRKTLIAPILIAVACLAGFLWTVDHIAGNCLDLKDVLTFCPYDTPK